MQWHENHTLQCRELSSIKQFLKGKRRQNLKQRRGIMYNNIIYMFVLHYLCIWTQMWWQRGSWPQCILCQHDSSDAAVSLCLTALCDVSDAAVYYDRYVCLCELLLAQGVPSTACCCLDRTTPVWKIQLPLSFNVQGPEEKKKHNDVEGRQLKLDKHWLCSFQAFLSLFAPLSDKI